MARKAKKRYARATVNGVDQVFEFDVEELDSQKLIAMALGVKPNSVKKVSQNSPISARPSWYTTAKSAKHQYAVDYKVRK